MNKKGQALVEFVMVIPVIIILVLVCVDFGHIYYEKTKLENTLNDTLIMLKDKNNTIEDVKQKLKNNKIKLEMQYKDDGYAQITISKKIKVYAPGLNLIIGNQYNADASRIIKYEQ